jgi:hypothetical protein
MSDTAAEAPAVLPPPDEVEVWWGGYSGWAMLPSFLVCVVLTGLIGWATWGLVPRGTKPIAFLGASGVLWVGQLTRWGYRTAVFTYRMTTRSLFRDRGALYPAPERVFLADVTHVSVKLHGLDRFGGVGQVRVHFGDKARPPLILQGVRDPGRAAELIRDWVHKARKQQDRPAGP